MLLSDRGKEFFQRNRLELVYTQLEKIRRGLKGRFRSKEEKKPAMEQMLLWEHMLPDRKVERNSTYLH